MTSFRAAVKRSTSSFTRQQSREDRPSYSRQASTRSNVDPFTLTDKLSRFSLEDIPIAAHPSPLPGRAGFPTPDADVIAYDDDDDDKASEVGSLITPDLCNSNEHGGILQSVGH